MRKDQIVWPFTHGRADLTKKKVDEDLVGWALERWRRETPQVNKIDMAPSQESK